MDTYRTNNKLDSRDIAQYLESNRYIRALQSTYDWREINIYCDEKEEEFYRKRERVYNYEIFDVLTNILTTLTCVTQDYKKIFDYEVDTQTDTIIAILTPLYCLVEECNILISNLVSRLEYRILSCKSKSKKKLNLYYKLLDLKYKFGYFKNINKLIKYDISIYMLINIIELIQELIENYFNSREKEYRKNRCKKFNKRQDREDEYLKLLNSYEYRTKKMSKRDIAKRLGVSPAAVTQFCKRHGIT